MKKIQLIVISLVAMLSVGFAFVPVASYAAVDPFGPCVEGEDNGSKICADKDGDATDIIKVIVNTMIFLVGVLSVISIIASGIMYSTSNGESANITKAKNTLTYAIVGLVVSLIAYAIVNWVNALLTPST